jgi:hypothetical protein
MSLECYDRVIKIAFSIAVVAACSDGKNQDQPSVKRALGDSKVKTTKIMLNQYANEAFPQWLAAHPGRACPGMLSELNEYTIGDGKDSWGRPLKMMCGTSLPPGVHGLAVVSAGEDGKEGTEDDIKSWE